MLKCQRFIKPLWYSGAWAGAWCTSSGGTGGVPLLELIKKKLSIWNSKLLVIDLQV